MKIKIRYFGLFKEFTGKQEEIIDAKEGVTVKEIREQILKGEYMTEEKLNVAICRMLKEILG